jgi:hypothetical protein
MKLNPASSEEFKFSTHNNFYKPKERDFDNNEVTEPNFVEDEFESGQYLFKKKTLVKNLGACFVFFYIEEKE